MLSFKQFLNEGRTAPVTIEEFKEWCEKNASKYLKHPYWLYRGVPVAIDFAIGNSAGSIKRESQGVPNNYTLWIDGHPKFEGYPKRSASFIATDRWGKAADFGEVYIVICSDDAKVGRALVSDIWHKSLKSLNGPDQAHGLNLYGLNIYTEAILNALSLGKNKKYFQFQNSLQHVKYKKVRQLADSHTFDYSISEGIKLMADIMEESNYRDLYELWDGLVSPEIFSLHTGADVSETMSLGEVWVEGECAFLPLKNPFNDIAQQDQFLNWLAGKNDEMAALVKTKWERKPKVDDDDEPF